MLIQRGSNKKKNWSMFGHGWLINDCLYYKINEPFQYKVLFFLWSMSRLRQRNKDLTNSRLDRATCFSCTWSVSCWNSWDLWILFSYLRDWEAEECFLVNQIRHFWIYESCEPYPLLCTTNIELWEPRFILLLGINSPQAKSLTFQG